MNRNQKIALGCGGAGCLGLIVVAIAGGLMFFYFGSRTSTNTNHNSGTNSNTNRSINRNSSTTETSPDESTDSSSISDDDKHKLFQAAGTTKDSALIQRVLRKLGFMKADGSTTGNYEEFVKDHIGWAIKNLDFINSINTPEKARAYVEEHIND